VAHAYNPSYSGCRDHKDCSSKPAWAKKESHLADVMLDMLADVTSHQILNH
jgi:hypothetical protein